MDWERLLRDHFTVVRCTRRGWLTPCPIHKAGLERNPSLAWWVSGTGELTCWCYACSASRLDIAAAAGIKLIDLAPHEKRRPRGSSPLLAGQRLGKQHVEAQKKIVAIYPYCQADGELVYEVVRFEPKEFRQRRPDPKHPGDYIWNISGLDRLLYNLPDLRQRRRESVVVCEGEKDCGSLMSRGILATTMSGGVGAGWHHSFSEALEGRSVAVVPDKDEAGLRHAYQVVGSLLDHGCLVRLVHLPPGCKDATEYFGNHNRDQFLQLVRSAPRWGG